MIKKHLKRRTDMDSYSFHNTMHVCTHDDNDDIHTAVYQKNTYTDIHTYIHTPHNICGSDYFPFLSWPSERCNELCSRLILQYLSPAFSNF